MLPVPEQPLPPAAELRPISRLRAALRRIDAWGPLAWKEILGGWRLRLPGDAQAENALVLPEGDEDGDEDERTLYLAVAHGLGPGEAVATCDWVVRHAWATLLAAPRIPAWTVRPGAAVRATNACWLAGDRVILRLQISLPYLGMGIDARRVGRFIRQVEAFAADLATRRARPELARWRRSVARQRALRAALPAAGLIAFLGEGALLPRAADGGPAAGAVPLSIPPGLRRTLDLGRHGSVTGWGIPQGVTAVTGAPYHGKSTVLQALQAGADDHPPGDGRELVVTDPSALFVQAEDGRPIKAQDLAGFFASLPGADAKSFTTARASGATSMAASVCQGLAGGSRLLLIDEDSAASNFLLIDPVLRQILGKTLNGTTTLLEALPDFARQGVSTVLVAGSNGHALAIADRVVQMDHWQPHDVTAKVRRLVGPPPAARRFTPPRRILDDTPDAVFGPRHFLALDLREPERPRVKLPAARGTSGWHTLDLRRSGWVLDPALVAGALLAAGWACRLAGGVPTDLTTLGQRYAAVVAGGATALDPFHTRIITVPPWPLVVSILERLPHPGLRSA